MGQTRVALALLLGGKGARFGSDKAFININNRPLWRYILERVLSFGLFDFVYLAANQGLYNVVKNWIEEEKAANVSLVENGIERMHSVYNCLKKVQADGIGCRFVAIHDGCRPYVDAELCKRAIEGAVETGAAIPCMPVRYTIKRCSHGADGIFVKETIDRSDLYETQTPGVFLFDELLNSYELAIGSKEIFIDDASIWERFAKRPVKVVQGDAKNIKITYPEDIDE